MFDLFHSKTVKLLKVFALNYSYAGFSVLLLVVPERKFSYSTESPVIV